MMRCLKAVLAAVIASALALPAIAIAKPSTGKRDLRIVVRPKYQRWHGYGFLPGYRQPPYLADWRDRSRLYAGRGDFAPRYWSGGEFRYGWGGPGFYRGRWNGGSFGPCWTSTPIGQIWNCGQ